ncbi:hypothetical protein NUW58_g4736 [Xylaria curta]|uniref:Uncharacterized protein n=2 Tax=Xylaria curta TaxID=42375 RepID=A0ACC1P6Q2_9PEZI|nr:hypothetical protein NUW58_g5688 [Xylaria curta]KAJ2987021.1 hypothetical protein NUW58_g4736 [Xylaria curta]
MDSALCSLIDTIVRGSKLSISLLRISNITEDSFHVSLEARLTKTGPASASITPMTVDLCGPAGHFGNMTLPALATQVYGTDVVVISQLMSIIDKEALRAFIRDIIQGGSVVLSLRNGQASISALGLGPRRIVFDKTLELPGMKGPVVSVHAASINQADPREVGPMSNSTAPLLNNPTTASISSSVEPESGNTISIVLHVANPSPFEIDFGTCFFDIQNAEGEALAELKGRLDIRRHHFEVTFQGNANKSVAIRLAADMKKDARGGRTYNKHEKNDGQSPEVRLVGKRCVGADWCDETIKGIDLPLQNVQKLFRALEIDGGVEKAEDKRGRFKWTQGWMR